jgi:predicted CoA-binding protein
VVNRVANSASGPLSATLAERRSRPYALAVIGLHFLVNEPDRLRELLQNARSIAVVGLSGDRNRPSYGVASTLLEYGYEIHPVNPNEARVLGRPVVPDLASLPGPVDVVDLFRRSELVGPHVDEAIALGAKVVWLQDGVIDRAAAERAHAAGLEVVMDRCMARDLAVLFGMPPLPGRTAMPR